MHVALQCVVNLLSIIAGIVSRFLHTYAPDDRAFLHAANAKTEKKSGKQITIRLLMAKMNKKFTFPDFRHKIWLFLKIP